MQRLDVSQVLKDFEGQPLSDGNPKYDAGDKDKKNLLNPLTLKACLKMILGSRPQGLEKGDFIDAFSAGLKVAAAEKEVILEQNEYDVVRKCVDVDVPGDNPYFGQILLLIQLRRMVKAAPPIDVNISAT